jgi:L-threonylcarbamoyladenylate synthase
MSPVIDCTTDEGLAKGIAAAAVAVRRGALVVLPTDTVYGLGADAFAPDAVTAMLTAKGRGREMPPPVLIPSVQTLDGLATHVPVFARDLIRAFWPGPLTLVFVSQSSLMWDLGDTNGTVAVRMPKHDITLGLLDVVGPMAVTSANVSGQAPAMTVLEASAKLGSAVSVYLDGGPCAASLPSTILDCTGEAPVILRAGAISVGRVQEALGEVELGN